MIEGLILFALALLPVLVLGYYTYYQDSDKEPKRLLIKLFLGGLLSAFLTVTLSLLIRSIFPYFNDEVSTFGGLKLLIYTFGLVAFVEEISKFLIVYLFSFHNREYDQLYDMIVYSVFVSLGFAWIENLLYVYDGGISLAISRLLFSVPTHASVAVFMGYYLSLSKLSEVHKKAFLQKKYLLYSIAIPTLLHGCYDFLAYSSNYLLVMTFFIFTCYLFVKANKRLHQMALINKELLIKKCPNCGNSLGNDNYCNKCGHKNIN